MAKIIPNEVPKETLKTFFRVEKQGLGLVIKVKPNSSREKLCLSPTGELMLHVRDAALEGAANTRVVELLSQIVSIPKSKIEIIAGHTSRIKRILFYGVNLDEIGEY